MKKLLLSVIPLSLCISSCGLTPPTLETPQEMPLIEIPTKPKNIDLSTSFTIYKKETDADLLFENVTVKKGFQVKENKTVVISIPVDSQNKQRQQEIMDKLSNNYGTNKKKSAMQIEQIEKLNDKADIDQFSTAAYFNKAEQGIEKSLLKIGFTVMDRSKFEAELRDRREQKGKSNDNSRALNSEIKRLDKQRENGLITDEKHTSLIHEAENKYSNDSSGNSRKAGKKELVDISELIRAAQEGKSKADYILQVNSFEIKPIDDSEIFLAKQDEIKALYTEHPELKRENKEKGFSTIVQPGYFAYLNAKLIEVESGNIVWVGEHRVESENVLNIDVEMSMARQVNNEQEVKSYASKYNKKIKKQRAELSNLLRLANNLDIDEDQQKRRIYAYNNALEQYKRLISSPTELPEWQFEYSVSEPSIDPQFPSAYSLMQLKRESNSSQEKHNKFIRLNNRVAKHKSALAKLVSQELINTISEE